MLEYLKAFSNIAAVKRKFSSLFLNFSLHDKTREFWKNSDAVQSSDLQLDVFGWVCLTKFEMDLIVIQASLIWYRVCRTKIE
jgi:hypothetical protein